MSSMEWVEYAARAFEPVVRRWATPGALARDVDPLVRQTKALDKIDAAVVDVLDGRIKQCMIFAPPQTGKSQRCSRWSPLWLLTCNPTLRIAIVSYELDTAVRWGRQIKRDIEQNPDIGITLIEDSRAAGRWETVQGGGIYSVGIRGALAGRPVDILIIDDPVKDRAAAESKTQRDQAWDFWENVAKVRARATILISTRWHADDLAGRLLVKEKGEWEVLSMPAVAEEEDDLLGRQIGEEIESAGFQKPGYYLKQQRTTSSYVWSSLFQQRPTLATGNLFKRADWRYWEPLGTGVLMVDGKNNNLSDCYKFITMDLATSVKTSADYTVAAAWAITVGGDLVLLDRVRERVPQSDHMSLIEPLRSRWLSRYDVTYIESRMFGSTLVYALGRKGLPIAELDADVDKLTRALPAAQLQTQHRIHLPRTAPWLDEWLDEHAEFPQTKHDDQVDVTAYAARVAIAHWSPMQSAEEVRSFVNSDPEDYVDFLEAQW